MLNLMGDLQVSLHDALQKAAVDGALGESVRNHTACVAPGNTGQSLAVKKLAKPLKVNEQ